MNPHQRHAYFKLTIVTLSVAAAIVLAFLGGLQASAAGFALMGALGLAPLLFRRPADGDDVLVDERDLLIHARASRVGFQIFWVVWVVGSMAAWVGLRSQEMVPVEVLPLTVLAGWALYTAIESAMTLAGYGSGS